MAASNPAPAGSAASATFALHLPNDFNIARNLPMIVRPELNNEPYCGNCGYRLTGATESSKCPECGRPLVEVLTRNSQAPVMGKRYRSKATLFGWPVIDIALGPANGVRIGKARGIIAIGDMAIGGIALGGMSCGIVALGGMSIGLFALGGLA